MGLNEKQLKKFEKALLELKAEVTRQVKGINEDVKATDSKGHSQHQAEDASDASMTSLELDVGNLDSKLLVQIDRALAKLKEGTYGICDESGEEIPLQRLEAIPYATLTVAQQEKLEKGL